MKRVHLFCLVYFALLAALLSGCGSLLQPAPPAAPTRGSSGGPAPSVLSEILLPAAVQANKPVIVSVGYYMGETSADGSHSLSCNYLDASGRAVDLEKWQASGKNRVEVHSLALQVEKPGWYFMDCDIDGQSQKMARFQVIEDVQNEVEAVVREVTAGPSGDSGVNFYAQVSFVFGSPAGGNLLCSYPGENGAPVKKTFPFTRPDPVEEYAGKPAQLQFDITVKKPGQYMVTCAVLNDTGNSGERSAAFAVRENVVARVRSVSVAPTGILGQQFHVTVTSSYGADSSTNLLCTYPGENGESKQQRISFVRPDPVKQYLGATREDGFDLTVKKAGTYRVTCRVDPGGVEQLAQFEVKETQALAINAVLTETGQNADNTLVFTDQVKLVYDPRNNTLTGTLAGETSSESTDSCHDPSGNVTGHNVYATSYNYITEVNSPLTLGQQASIPTELAAHVHIVVVSDSHVCEPVSGDMDLKWTGALTILLAEDGSYTLSTQYSSTMGAAWSGSTTGKATPAAN